MLECDFSKNINHCSKLLLNEHPVAFIKKKSGFTYKKNYVLVARINFLYNKCIKLIRTLLSNNIRSMYENIYLCNFQSFNLSSVSHMRSSTQINERATAIHSSSGCIHFFIQDTNFKKIIFEHF